MAEAWERQKGESSQAYEAYNLYQSMGGKRSLAKVAEKLAKSETLMSRWSAKWHWVKRAREYDNKIKAEDIEQKQKDVALMFKRQGAIGEQMQKKAWDALKDIDPKDIPFQYLIPLISYGAKLEQQAKLYGRTDDTEKDALDNMDSILASAKEEIDNAAE